MRGSTHADDKHAGKKAAAGKNCRKRNKKITPKKKDSMLYVGMDVHKATIQVAAMDAAGNIVLETNIKADRNSVDRLLSKIPKGSKFVIESSSVYRWIYDHMADDLGLDVVISNPFLTKAIAASKKKTDKTDARVLADLLRGGYSIACYIPSKKTMEERELVRTRRNLINSRTIQKNRISGILLQKGIKIKGDKFAYPGIARLQKLGDYRIDAYLRDIETLNDCIIKIDARIRNAVRENSDAQLLMSIKGVGYYTALAIAATIDCVSRFPDSSKLCSYAGVVPSVRNSADTVHHGRITKRGDSMVRWILTEAVKSHIRFEPDSRITEFYLRIKKKRGHGKAVVATASKMLRVMHRMLKEKKEFDIHYS